ncbi:MAG: MerR family DNA-binding transcriptional regulator [Clostridiales bacterium]|nr:MerR family DNA-binding transcriptional regulator [Clostridiales bacterium]
MDAKDKTICEEAKEFFTVGEFAEVTGIDAATLRFYDKIGLFSPAIRDPENNYRYYCITQILTLNFISVLSDLNIPLKTLVGLRDDRTPFELLRLLEKQEKQLDIELQALRARYSIIHARRELINYGTIVAKGFEAVDGVRVVSDEKPGNGISVDENTVQILHRDDKEYTLWPRNEYAEGDNFIKPLAAICHEAEMRHINLSFPVGGYYESMDLFSSAPDQPQHFFSVDPTGKDIRKEGQYLIGFARGSYGDVGDMPVRMEAYAKENSLEFHGPVWLMYMFDEVCTSDSSLYLSQACVAVKKRKSK